MTTPQRTPPNIIHPQQGWLFFRHKAEPHLWCAVVHGHVIPAFLLMGAWRHFGHETAALLIGRFPQRQARQGAALNGFYLFQAFAIGSAKEPVEGRSLPPMGGAARRAPAACSRAA